MAADLCRKYAGESVWKLTLLLLLLCPWSVEGPWVSDVDGAEEEEGIRWPKRPDNLSFAEDMIDSKGVLDH